MDTSVKKTLASDPDGLITYEYIANNIDRLEPGDMQVLIDNMVAVDLCGQFCVSAARFLGAIDRTLYDAEIRRLMSAAIEKDRERAYIGYLLPDFWGQDYAEHAAELSAADDHFRRIYKRLYPTGM